MAAPGQPWDFLPCSAHPGTQQPVQVGLPPPPPRWPCYQPPSCMARVLMVGAPRSVRSNAVRELGTCLWIPSYLWLFSPSKSLFHKHLCTTCYSAGADIFVLFPSSFYLFVSLPDTIPASLLLPLFLSRPLSPSPCPFSQSWSLWIKLACISRHRWWNTADSTHNNRHVTKQVLVLTSPFLPITNNHIMNMILDFNLYLWLIPSGELPTYSIFRSKGTEVFKAYDIFGKKFFNNTAHITGLLFFWDF